MKQKSLIISIFFFSFSLIIDILLKLNQSGNGTNHLNRGFIFGTLQDLPPSLTLVTLTSFGGVLVFLYLLFAFLLSDELITLKIGLGLLSGGILGNVIDRAMHGGTLDFIPLQFLDKVYVYYNPADLFQWIGAGLIILNILKNDQIIWYPENQRGLVLVNPKEQIRFAIKFTMISFSTCLILGLFSISYLTLSLHALNNFSNSAAIGFAISYLAISLVFNALAFMAGIFLSQRSAGPLYAFEKYVEALLSGEKREFKIREGDNYQHLIEVANSLKKHFDNEPKE